MYRVISEKHIRSGTIYWKVAKGTFQGKNKLHPPHSSGGRRGKIQAESDEYNSDYKIQVLTLRKTCVPRLVGNQFFEFSVHNTKSVENQLAKNILKKKRKRVNLNLLLSHTDSVATTCQVHTHYCDPIFHLCRKKFSEGRTCMFQKQCGKSLRCQWGKCQKAKAGDPGALMVCLRIVAKFRLIG